VVHVAVARAAGVTIQRDAERLRCRACKTSVTSSVLFTSCNGVGSFVGGASVSSTARFPSTYCK
jgi:hypothetical protein